MNSESRGRAVSICDAQHHLGGREAHGPVCAASDEGLQVGRSAHDYGHEHWVEGEAHRRPMDGSEEGLSTGQELSPAQDSYHRQWDSFTGQGVQCTENQSSAACSACRTGVGREHARAEKGCATSDETISDLEGADADDQAQSEPCKHVLSASVPESGAANKSLPSPWANLFVGAPAHRNAMAEDSEHSLTASASVEEDPLTDCCCGTGLRAHLQRLHVASYVCLAASGECCLACVHGQ